MHSLKSYLRVTLPLLLASLAIISLACSVLSAVSNER